jgi:signal transduction histidine kinase
MPSLRSFALLLVIALLPGISVAREAVPPRGRAPLPSRKAAQVLALDFLELLSTTLSEFPEIETLVVNPFPGDPQGEVRDQILASITERFPNRTIPWNRLPEIFRMLQYNRHIQDLPPTGAHDLSPPVDGLILAKVEVLPMLLGTSTRLGIQMVSLRSRKYVLKRSLETWEWIYPPEVPTILALIFLGGGVLLISRWDRRALPEKRQELWGRREKQQVNIKEAAEQCLKKYKGKGIELKEILSGLRDLPESLPWRDLAKLKDTTDEDIQTLDLALKVDKKLLETVRELKNKINAASLPLLREYAEYLYRGFDYRKEFSSRKKKSILAWCKGAPTSTLIPNDAITPEFQHAMNDLACFLSRFHTLKRLLDEANREDDATCWDAQKDTLENSLHGFSGKKLPDRKKNLIEQGESLLQRLGKLPLEEATPKKRLNGVLQEALETLKLLEEILKTLDAKESVSAKLHQRACKHSPNAACTAMNAFLDHHRVPLSKIIDEIRKQESTKISITKGRITSSLYARDPDEARERWKSCLNNMLQNAREGRDGTQGANQLKLMATGDKSSWKLSLQDNGPGLEDYGTAHIGNKTKPKGSGVGLRDAQDLISAHGGYLKLEASDLHYHLDSSRYGLKITFSLRPPSLN